VYDLSQYKHDDDDVLIMASDGLWERLTSRKVKKNTNSLNSSIELDDISFNVKVFNLDVSLFRGYAAQIGIFLAVKGAKGLFRESRSSRNALFASRHLVITK